MTSTLSELSMPELATYLQEQITRKTAGRIHDLRVFRPCPETDGSRIVVLGRAGSYYVRQLALSGALEAMELLGCPPETVELQIQVSPKKRCRLDPSHTFAGPESEEHGRGYLWPT